MALPEFLSGFVDKATDYLIDIPMGYLQKGLGAIGLDGVGNIFVDSGKLLGGGIDKLALGQFGGGVGDLYSGLDTLVGGVLPGGQNLAQGYIGQLYTGADKMLGGVLPNFGGVGYVEPTGAIGAVMPGGTTSGAGMGAGGSVGATGPMGPAGAGVAPQSGVTTTLYRGGAPVGSLTQPTSDVVGGAGSSFLDKAMGAAQLAATVGGVAAMLDGGGGGGGGNPAAGRPKPSRTGGALQASRRMGAPTGGMAGRGAGASSGGGMSGGGGGPRGGISGLGEGEVSESDKLAAFNSLVAGGMPADEAQDVVDALSKGSDAAFQALMPGGSGGTQSVEDIDVGEVSTEEASRAIEVAKEMDELEREVNKLSESVQETEEAVEAQEEAEEVEEADIVLDALRPQSDIPGGPRAEYLSNPSTQRAMEILPMYDPNSMGTGTFFNNP